MKLDRKNVRTILLIIAFAVLLYTAAQNLASVYGAVRTVWRVFGVVITGLAMAFVLNVPLKLFENRVFYGMSEDRRPLVRKLRRPVSLVFALVVSLGLIGILIAVVLPPLTATVAATALSPWDWTAMCSGRTPTITSPPAWPRWERRALRSWVRGMTVPMHWT